MILEEVTPACEAVMENPTAADCWKFFLDRCRTNLHIVLCFSPIGDDFRTRLRMFPSLVNCCTIDWFSEWPPEALSSVADQQLAAWGVSLEEKVMETTVKMFSTVHVSVETSSKVFKEEERRFNYVTPTSYLELLNMFNNVLEKKRTDNS